MPVSSVDSPIPDDDYNVDEVVRPEGVIGQLALRSVAMPENTNHLGNIFGGWILSQMDLAGNTFARHVLGVRAVTVAVGALTFHRPLTIGDELSCYTRIFREGRTSVTIHVQAWARRFSGPRTWIGPSGQTETEDTGFVLVTEGNFTYVAINAAGEPTPLRPQNATVEPQ